MENPDQNSKDDLLIKQPETVLKTTQSSATAATALNAKMRPQKFLILITMASSISGFMFGYDTGYISAALVQIGTDLLNKTLTSADKELITSATSLGALISVIVSGVVANIIGRKNVLYGSNVMFAIGTILQLVAKTVSMMAAGRLVLGFGVGCGSLIAPLMLSELSPPEYRSRLIVTNCIFITAGQLVAYLINLGLTNVSHGWKVSVGLCMVPAALQLVLFVFLPDTPRFYVIKGDYKKAKAVLMKVQSFVTEETAEAIVLDMVASNSLVRGKPLAQIWKSIKLVHTRPANLRALILACGLQGIQQFTGFNSLMYFSATIFETIGFHNPIAVSIIIAATNFVFTVVAMCIVDVVGRRRILLWAIPGMCISLVICAIAFRFLGITVESVGNVQIERMGITGWGIMVIVGMVLFVASYAIGIGNSAWIGVEFFSDVNVRSMGCMFAAATNWSGSLFIASTFLTMLAKIRPSGTFALFAGLCFISFFFVYFLLPEVAGLDLEETSQLLENGFNVRAASALYKERMKNARHAETEA